MDGTVRRFIGCGVSDCSTYTRSARTATAGCCTRKSHDLGTFDCCGDSSCTALDWCLKLNRQKGNGAVARGDDDCC